MADFHDEVKVGPVWPPDLLEPEQHVALEHVAPGLVEGEGLGENNVSGLPSLAVNSACHSDYSPGFLCQTYLEIQIGVKEQE